MREQRMRRLKAQRARRNRKIAVMFFSIICIIAAAVICRGFVVNAQKDNSVPTYKYYTEIMVQSGDTLWDIAGEYATEEYADLNEYMDEIRAINSLYSDDICYGDRLIVPYYDTLVKQ